MNNSVENNQEPVLMNSEVVNPVVNETKVMQEAPQIVNSSPVMTPVETKVAQPMPQEVPSQPQPMQNPVIEPQPSLEQTKVPMDPSTPDPNGMVNENLKKVEINYQPPSKFKVVLMIIFFIALLAMIIFLPDISSLINKYRSGNLNTEEDIITTGRLICTLSSSTSNLDKNYSLAFKFTNSKLDRTEFVITTRGDPSLDEEALDKLNNTCKQLKINTKKITGVTVQCNYANGKLEEIQTFDLANIDTSQLTSAFEEAGGNNPEYKYQQDIDSIEKNMNASGYKCKRER